MEIQGFDLIGFDLFGIDLNTIDINADNSVDVKESYIPTIQSPYIKGHITTSDNTFTFKVNNTSTSISVNANGDFKYKPTVTITQLDFVGVPELESLELYKINGVTTFDVDYPTQVTFNKCDNITENSKVDVYHIRGTATDDFQFTLKYIDRNNNVTTVTEHAVIDGNGKWDISYSGKKIKELTGSFKENTTLTGIEFTENFDKATNIGAYANGAFYGCSNLVSARFKNALFNNITSCASLFQGCSLLQYVDLTEATMDKVTDCSRMFNSCTAIETINLGNAIFGIATNAAAMFYSCNSLVELNLDKCTFANIESTALFIIATNLKALYVPNTATLPITTTFQYSKLSYDSMLRIAGWLKDLTGLTTQTVTFKKATYDALTAEQKATLEGIIVTQKHWTLATV